MSGFNHFADTRTGGGHMQCADQEICSNGDLWAPSPVPRVGTGASVQSREKRRYMLFPEPRVTMPWQRVASSLGTHSPLTQLADAPDSTEHPGFQRKEVPPG